MGMQNCLSAGDKVWFVVQDANGMCQRWAEWIASLLVSSDHEVVYGGLRYDDIRRDGVGLAT